MASSWEERRRQRQAAAGGSSTERGSSYSSGYSSDDPWERRRAQRAQMDTGSEEAIAERAARVDAARAASQERWDDYVQQHAGVMRAQQIYARKLEQQQLQNAHRQSQYRRQGVIDRSRQMAAERPEQMARWLRMDADAYDQKAAEERRNGTPIYNRFGYETTRRSEKADEYERRAEQARQQVQGLLQYQRQREEADRSAEIAQDPAAWMRWARMEADAYEQKLRGDQYGGSTDGIGGGGAQTAYERESYDKYQPKIDEALRLYDQAYIALMEQEAAGHTGNLNAPEETNGLYRLVNDQSRWYSKDRDQQTGENQRFHNAPDTAMADEILRQEPDAFMTAAQRQTFNYLASTKGMQAAERYYNALVPQLEEARTAATQGEWAEFTQEHPYIATGMSTLMAPEKIPAGIASIGSALAGKEINRNSTLYQPVQAQGTIRQIAPEITNWTGNARIFGQDMDTFLYGTITSALDSTLNAAIGGTVGRAASGILGGLSSAEMTTLVSNATSALMGAEMLPDTIIEEKAKGRTDEQAVSIAIIRSLIEGITEKYSIESFLGDPRTIGKVLAKSFVSEGGEEIASNWLNDVVNAVVADPEGIGARWRLRRDSGENSLMALAEEIGNSMIDDVSSFLAGGLSGIGMTGAHYATGVAAHQVEQREAYKQLAEKYQADPQAVVAEALEIDGQDKLAQKAQDRLNAGKSVSDRILATLIRRIDGRIERGTANTETTEKAESQPADEAEAAPEPNLSPVYRDYWEDGQSADQLAEELYQEYGETAHRSAEAEAPPNVQSTSTERQTRQTERTEEAQAPRQQNAKSGKEAQQRAPARQRTAYVRPSSGTAVAGTDILRVERSGEGGVQLVRTDGSRAALDDAKTAGTALEVLEAAKELPEHSDPLTLNGMLRAYEGYLAGKPSNTETAETFFDGYTAALYAGIEGESRSVLSEITEDSAMQRAMADGYSRGVEIAQGQALAGQLGSAGAAALEEYGYRYAEQFGAFYQAGQEGLSFRDAQRMTNMLTMGESRKAEMQAAFEAGRKDGTEYETYKDDLGFEEDRGGGEPVSLDSSERAAGVGAGEPAGELGEGAERAAVSAKALDLENGTDRKTARVLRATELTEEMWGIKRDAKKHGMDVQFIEGYMEIRAGNRVLRARGAKIGNQLIVQTDNLSASFYEVYRHERLHGQIASGEIQLEKAIRLVRETIGEGKFKELLPGYRKAYAGVYSGSRFEQNVQEELCADAAAGLIPGVKAVNLSSIKEGQKNSAQTGETKYTLDAYSEKQLKNWENSRRISVYQNDAQLLEFVKQAKKSKENGIRMYFGKVGDKLASEIMEKTSYDFSGLNVTLYAENVRKTFKSHGNAKKEATRGQRAVEDTDFAMLPEIIGNPDSISKSNEEYRGRPTVVFTKRKGNELYSIVAVNSDGSHMELYLQTMYVGVKNGDVPGVVNANAVTATSETEPSIVSKNRVAQDKGKSQEGKTSIDVSERDSAGRELSAEQASSAEYDSVDVDPYDVDPVNDITDEEKIKYLVEEFEKNGYRGRPVVALGSESEQSIALTGSHRILAAREAGIEIPVVYIEYDENNPLIQNLADAQGDDERAQVAAELYEEGTISKPVYDLIVREEDLNYENYGVPYSEQLRYSVSEEAEPTSSAEYAQMQSGRTAAVQAQEQKKRQETLYSHMMERSFELGRQFTEGTQKDVNTDDLPGIAADILRFAGKNAMSRTELEQRLEDIAMKAAREYSPMEAYETAKAEADALAADMIRNATGQNAEMAETWDALKKTMRSAASIQKNGRLTANPVKLAISGQNRADLESAGGYESMRKRLMGYAFLSPSGTPVEEFYQKQLSQKFPEYFPESIQNPADQLIRIVDVLDRFRQIFKSPYMGALAEDTAMLSQEIVQRLYNSNVAEPGAEAFTMQHEDMLRAHYENKLAEARTQMQQEVDALRQMYENNRTARQEQKDRDALLKIAQRLDRVKVGSAWKAKAAELVGNLDTIAKSMTGRTIIGDRIGNLSSESIETVREDDLGRRYVDIETLKDWVKEMQAQNPDFMPDQRTMDKIDRLNKVQIADMDIGDVRALLNAMQNLENEMRTSKKLLDAQDRRDVAVQTAETISDIESSKGVPATGVKAAWTRHVTNEGLSPVRFLHRVTGYNDADPLYRAAQALQKGQTAMHDYSRRAEAMFRGFMEDKAFMASLGGKKARVIEITGLGESGKAETVKITPDMQIAIFLHSFNNDNVRHAERGGFVVPDYELLRKGKVSEAYEQGRLLRMRRSQMRAVQENMTEREIQFARAVYRYFNTMSKNEINEVSRKLLGYDIAGVKNYYPIETNRDFGSGDPETVKRDGTIEGMGILKSRQGAAGPINLRGAVDTLTKSIDRHGKYVGLAIPVRNFGKLYGNTTWQVMPTEESGALPTQNAAPRSLKRILNRKWGSGASAYIDKLMADIQNPSKNFDSWARTMAKVRSNYAGSVLTMNASVAIKQAASYPTAAAVVGWDALAKASKYLVPGVKADIEFIAQHTPLLWYRSKGYSTQELGDMAKGQKQIPKGLNWIQGVDVKTTMALWKAAEYFVQKQQPKLEVRSDAYWDAVTEVYERIVLETQPNYTTMERPQLLRSENTLLQNLAMFKTQPFQNFNIAYDALANLQAKERQLKAAQDAARTDSSEETQARLREAKQNLKNAKKGAARGVSALVISAGVFSAMTLLWNIIRGNIKRYRDDDKNEINLKTIGEAFVSKTFLSDTVGSLAGILPFGSDAYEVFASLVLGEQYYGMEALTPSAISDFLEQVVKLDDTISDVVKAIKGDSHAIDSLLAVNQIGTTASKLFGAPVENVENLMKAAAFWLMQPFMSKEESSYWYRYYTQKTTAQGRSSADKADIYAAYRSGNTDGYQSMRDAMKEWVWQENEQYKSGEITRAEAQEKAETSMNNAMAAQIKDEYMTGGLTDAEATDLLQKIGGKDKDKAAEAVAKWHFQHDGGGKDASAAQASAYYEFAQPAGISMETFEEAWDFHNNVEADKDSSGKTVPGSAKQKVVDYIRSLGLSKAAERALWNALKGTWSDKGTPWA